jgi:hypothetical protein
MTPFSTSRIDESRSPGNVRVVQGDTAMLVCTVLYVGDKSVRLKRESHNKNLGWMDGGADGSTVRSITL